MPYKMTRATGCLTATTSLGSCLIRCTSLAKTDTSQRRPAILTRRSTRGQVNAVSCPLLPTLEEFNGLLMLLFLIFFYISYLQYHSTVGAIVSALCTSLSFSQIIDGALCRALIVQREFVSPRQVTHLPLVWDVLLPLA